MNDCNETAAAYQRAMKEASGMIAGQAINHEQVMRDQRIQSAIWTLSEATRIRADADLMAQVRAWVREKRAELGVFLDDIGA